MKKLVVGTGAAGAAAVAMLTLGVGTAAADDYAGQTYSEAAAAAGDAGQTVVIASRTGGKLADADCIVERSQAAPFIGGGSFAHVSDTVQFYLNCNGGFATATTPGSSMGSVEGRKFRAAAEEAAAQQQAEIEAASTPDE